MTPRPSPSLRARVALVSGAVAALVAVGLAAAYFALLGTASTTQLDRTVATMRVRVAGPADLPFPPEPPPGAVRVEILSAPTPDLPTPNLPTPDPHSPNPPTPNLPTPDPHSPNPPTPGLSTPDPHSPNPPTPGLSTPDPHSPNPPTPGLSTPDPHSPNPPTPGLSTPDPHSPNPPTPGLSTPDPHSPNPPTPGLSTPDPRSLNLTTPDPHSPESPTTASLLPPGSHPMIADTAVAPVAGAPGMRVVLHPDIDAVDSAVARSRLLGVSVAVAGVLLAAGLGWVLAGFVARPLRRLATAAHGIDTLETLPPLSGRGAREAEELSDALTRMLSRLEAAHAETARALAGARDFAAVCAHELRTPLTSLRTDLQVLATKDLPAAQRDAVIADVLGTEARIEQTLTDLERLAVGELTEPDAYETFDLCDTLDRAVQDARRRHPGVAVDLTECAAITVTGLPGGISLIVTNAVANAVQHGRADRVAVAARASGAVIELTVDDNGRGLPAGLGDGAFDRFVKGPGSPGSGLGLALVRQQAELHSGTAELTHGPLGGARLTVRIAV